MMETGVIMLEADYLIIGAGASGMAFADELMHNTSDITFIMIDKHAKPGGHWNDAYDFVKLHQPAAFYGVNSKPLGNGSNDLASFSQISAYYELVMKEFLASGRVKFFPQCVYKENGVFQSMMEPGLEYTVNVLKKIVDATYLSPTIPSLRKPEYGILEGVNLVPVNGLSHNQSAWKRYVIIGGGKTGIDAVLFLLDQSVNPDHITWVIPNDYWILNRNCLYPENWYSANTQGFNCMLECEHSEELYKKWEEIGFFLRLDISVEPRRMRGGTITEEELGKLRLIKDIIRKGRIDYIETTRIIFEEGSEVEVDENEHTLYVDCSANGTTNFIPQKIFNGTNIIIQQVMLMQTPFSAAVVADFEINFPDDEDKKNEILKPIRYPQCPKDFIIRMKDEFRNKHAISQVLGASWFRKCRLHILHHIPFLDYIRYKIDEKFYGMKLLEAFEKILRNMDKEKSIENNV